MKTTKQFKGMQVEHYQIDEGKPTIVFLHDSLGCIQLWRDFPMRLAEALQCNCVVYDRLGYGLSEPMPTYERPLNYLELEADLLNELLLDLEIREAYLFGHSDGGSIALIGSSKYPELVKGLICEAGHIFVEEITLNGIYAAMRQYETTNLAERLAKYHGAKVEYIFKAWTLTWTRADFRDWNIEHFLSSIKCPLLFIQGDKDEYGTMDQVNKTLAQVGGSTKACIIPGIGHTPHKEAEEVALSEAIRFLQDIF